MASWGARGRGARGGRSAGCLLSFLIEIGSWLTVVGKTDQPHCQGLRPSADCAGTEPGSAPGAGASCLLQPAASACGGHSPGPAASRGRVAHKQGCFYLLASACGFLRHSAGTIIKLICI